MMVDARVYHDRTSHTPEGIRQMEFSPDESNLPRLYKRYLDLPRIRMPGRPAPPSTPALSAIATAQPEPAVGQTEPTDIDVDTVQTLCRYAAGVMKTLEVRGTPTRFRAASCTGKLYHIELYVVTGPLDGLDPGVYHYDPRTGDFDILRRGDYRGTVADATGDYQPVATAPVTFIATSQWWRNAWKYRERTYRHAFWDSGTILANLLATAHGAGHDAMVVAGFADDLITHLLGLDPAVEAPLEIIPIGEGNPSPEPPELTPIDPPEAPLSSDPKEYQLITDAWRSSRLSDGCAARQWRRDAAALSLRDRGLHDPGDGDTYSLDPVDPATASSRPIGNTIERRGSAREYSHEPVSSRMLATVLDRALTDVPGDWSPGDESSRVVDYYCLIHAVEDLPAGIYQYHPDAPSLERLGETDRTTAGRLALGQSVVGDAAVNVYMMADIDALVDELGNRGYRLAQLASGITLGRLYLATYAHRRLGGRGFTFFDHLVTEHLSPRADNQTPMCLFAFGHPGD